MKNLSPLRYPGGKSAMADLLRQIRALNDLEDQPLAEPFAGGAGASLSLLLSGDTQQIFINDADPAIYDFWRTIINTPEPFLRLLNTTPISINEWRRQRHLYEQTNISALRRGFAAFYLNRCNRSGIIINAGPVGGLQQEGRWKLNARYNKSELRARITRLAQYRHRIHVSGQDAIRFIRSLAPESTSFFIDPPYFAQGHNLYFNSMTERRHARLASLLKSMTHTPWILTYDDCPQVRRMYANWATIRPFALRYSAADRHIGNELLILPKWIHVPISQSSAAIDW